MFGGIDFVAGLMLIGGILMGLVRGFLGTLIDLISIFLGLALGSFVYLAPVRLFRHFNITGIAVEIICFVLSVFVLTFTAITLFEMLRKRVEWKHFLDRLAGAGLGILEGFILSSGILILMSTSSQAATEISQSLVAGKVLRFLPAVLEKMERHNIVLPKLIMLPSSYPEEFEVKHKTVRFTKISFVKLDGATCLKCGGKVHFAGYFVLQGARLTPKFVCSQCGRTSDGCQTYEGFHAIYGSCPVELAKKGQRFDCGSWPNHEWVSPGKTCPVCGKSLEIWEWQAPQAYR